MGDQVKLFADGAALSDAAAQEVVRAAREAIAERARFTLALSGGRTPKEVHRLLGTVYRGQVAWEQVHIFWADERYVPHDSPDSNLAVAGELLDLPNVYPMPTGLARMEEAARAYEETLKAHAGGPLDLVLLGMGEDGHTASLFPGHPALGERERLVVPVRNSPKPPPERLSLTLPALTGARRCLFLVTGESKREVMREILTDPARAGERYPAALVSQAGNAEWYLDEAAY